MNVEQVEIWKGVRTEDVPRDEERDVQEKTK